MSAVFVSYFKNQGERKKSQSVISSIFLPQRGPDHSEQTEINSYVKATRFNTFPAHLQAWK